MQKEIQTARLGEEEKGGHSRGGPNGGMGLVWAMVVLTRRTKISFFGNGSGRFI